MCEYVDSDFSASVLLIQFIHNPPSDHSSSSMAPAVYYCVCVSRSSLCPRELGSQSSESRLRSASARSPTGPENVAAKDEDREALLELRLYKAVWSLGD